MSENDGLEVDFGEGEVLNMASAGIKEKGDAGSDEKNA
jgi:hypothetical protein